jgi:diguanylate cyclase (GGDEF)-like protein
MHLITRRDGPLVTALIFAALVVFQDPVRSVLAFARQVEVGYRLDLVPGLVILLVMFGFHESAKRQEARRMAEAAAAESRQLLERTRELEQLSRCGRGLAQALSLDALRVAVLRYVPDLLGDAEAWLLGSSDSRWEVLADTRFNTESWWNAHLTPIVLEAERLPIDKAPFRVEAWWCFPLVARESAVGILGVRVGNDGPSSRVERLIEALGALLAVAIRNAQLFAQMQSESSHDPLTGCLRRPPALAILKTELARSRRTRNPVSVMMFDLDGFKRLNDSHGHPCGDAALAGVGGLLAHHLRSSDAKCRYGGDEFLVVLPETPSEGALQVATNLCRAIGEMKVAWGGKVLGVTASVGVVTCVGGNAAPDQLIARADEALYAAKRSGRNCVRSVPEDGTLRMSPQLDLRVDEGLLLPPAPGLDISQEVSAH